MSNLLLGPVINMFTTRSLIEIPIPNDYDLVDFVIVMVDRIRYYLYDSRDIMKAFYDHLLVYDQDPF